MQISTILDQIDLHSIALPKFQRGFVWNRDQVRGMMHSLYRKHPIGSLLVWVTKAEEAQARGDVSLPPGSVKLLLDGQQRITSLYGIIRGEPPEFFDGDTKVISGLYFNLEDEEFKLTRERIRQIESKALRRLRHPTRSRKLKGYLE